MIPGIMAGQMRGVAGGLLWTPLNMAVVPQIYLDAQDSAVTDVSGACSAISNLGAMGTDGDFSQGTSTKRPTILASAINGKRALSFDGADDVLLASTTAVKAIFRNAPAAWAFTVHKKRTLDGSPTSRYLFYSPAGGGAARFGLLTGLSGAGEGNKPSMFARRLDAEGAQQMTGSAVVQGAYALVFTIARFSTRAGSITVNGAVSVSNATFLPTAGNTSDTAHTTDAAIGAFTSGSLASDVDLAAVIFGNTIPSDSDILKLEGWAAHKYGLTASLPGGHPYKTVAPTT